MKLTTLPSDSSLRFRAWLLGATILALVSFAVDVSAQAVLPAYYSTGGPATTVATGGNVSVGATASAGALSAYAQLDVSGLSVVGSPVSARFALTGTAPAGYRAGVVLANNSSSLDLTALGAVRLRTYLNNVVRETKLVRVDLLQASLGGSALPTQLEFTSTQSFDAVEFEVLSVASLNRSFRVFYAYGVQPGVQTRADGYISRFAPPAAGQDYFATTATGLLCVATDVENASNVADYDLTNAATLKSTLTVACNPALRTRLTNTPSGGIPAGYYAGFVIGQNSVLDASVLSSISITTYLGNTPVQTGTGLGLLSLALLPNNKAQVSFKTTAPFDGVRIERVGLLTALDDLDVYYGFGLAPQAFEDINPVLSDFSALPADAFTASADQQVSVSVDVKVGAITTRFNALPLTISSVSNPQFAADNNTTNNYAQLNTLGIDLGSLNLAGTVTLATPITTPATASLKLKLNGTGKAGNRVGFVVSQGSGLLDLTALQRLTISTYDANNKLIETKTGNSLLGVTLLGSTSQTKVSFLASRDFTYAQLTVTAAASVVSNTRVYYAFAEDVPIISLQYPLPVELTSFSGKWAGSAAELSWATASEKNSSHFVVERSAGADELFRPVGQVAAAGNSTSARTYKLRDAEAAAQHAAILYYRLRQVDIDGKEAFSPVVAVAVSKLASSATPQLQVYPNPAADAQAVMVQCLNLPGAGGTIQTYSEMGQLVSQQTLAEPNAQLQLPALAPGLYHLVLRNASGQQVASQRLVVGSR